MTTEYSEVLLDTNIIIQIKKIENLKLYNDVILKNLKLNISFVSIIELLNHDKDIEIESLMYLIQNYDCYLLNFNGKKIKLEKKITLDNIKNIIFKNKIIIEGNEDYYINFFLRRYYDFYKKIYDNISITIENNLKFKNKIIEEKKKIKNYNFSKEDKKQQKVIITEINEIKYSQININSNQIKESDIFKLHDQFKDSYKEFIECEEFNSYINTDYFEFFLFFIFYIDTEFILLQMKKNPNNMLNDNIILSLSTTYGIPIFSCDVNLIKRSFILSIILMTYNLFPLLLDETFDGKNSIKDKISFFIDI